MKIAVIGGDARAVWLRRRVEQEWGDCLSYGLDRDCAPLAQLENADVALFPYPFSVKGEQVQGLCASYPVDRIMSALADNAMLIAGRGLRAIRIRTQAQAVRAKPLFFRR